MPFDQSAMSAYNQLAQDADPWIHIGHLRRTKPVFHSDQDGLHLVVSHRHIRQVLNDHEAFTQDVRHYEHFKQPPSGSFQSCSLIHGLTGKGEVEQFHIRDIVRRAIESLDTTEYASVFRRLLDKAISETLKSGQDVVELGQAIILPCLYALMTRMLGKELVGRQTEVIAALQSLLGGVPDHDIDAIHGQKWHWERLYLVVRAARKRSQSTPGKDLLSALVSRSHEYGGMGEDEFFSVILNVMSAGIFTLFSMASELSLNLIQDPATIGIIRDKEGVSMPLVREIIRARTGARLTLVRFARTEGQLGGNSVKAGELVVLLPGGANRDPEVYDQPEKVLPHRRVGRLLGFGYGTARCPAGGFPYGYSSK